MANSDMEMAHFAIDFLKSKGLYSEFERRFVQGELHVEGFCLTSEPCPGSGFAREAHGSEIVAGTMLCAHCNTEQPIEATGITYDRRIKPHWRKKVK